MSAFFSWLANTRAGRNILAFGAALAALFFAAVKIFSAGRNAEKTKQNQAAIEAHQTRSKIDDETRKMDDAAVRRDLDTWRVRKPDNS